jgi:hypothetical protein
LRVVLVATDGVTGPVVTVASRASGQTNDDEGGGVPPRYGEEGEEESNRTGGEDIADDVEQEQNMSPHRPKQSRMDPTTTEGLPGLVATAVGKAGGETNGDKGGGVLPHDGEEGEERRD